MIVKRPVSGSLARAFISIILLSVLTSGIALMTLASSLRDAEAINIAGSLRMQSYRLGYDLERNSAGFSDHRLHWQNTLNSPVLKELDRWYVPGISKNRLSAVADRIYMRWTAISKRGIKRGIRIISSNMWNVLMLSCSHFSTMRNTKCSWWWAISSGRWSGDYAAGGGHTAPDTPTGCRPA